jgi:hypothetical protein
MQTNSPVRFMLTLDDFTDEEWKELEEIRLALPPLPPEVDDFLACQRLGPDDHNVVINASARHP